MKIVGTTDELLKLKKHCSSEPACDGCVLFETFCIQLKSEDKLFIESAIDESGNSESEYIINSENIIKSILISDNGE